MKNCVSHDDCGLLLCVMEICVSIQDLCGTESIYAKVFCDKDGLQAVIARMVCYCLQASDVVEGMSRPSDVQSAKMDTWQVPLSCTVLGDFQSHFSTANGGYGTRLEHLKMHLCIIRHATSASLRLLTNSLWCRPYCGNLPIGPCTASGAVPGVPRFEVRKTGRSLIVRVLETHVDFRRDAKLAMRSGCCCRTHQKWAMLWWG